MINESVITNDSMKMCGVKFYCVCLRPNVHVVFCAWYNICTSIMYKVKMKKENFSYLLYLCPFRFL